MGVGWSVVDLFCGAGGLTNGFRRAGFNIAAGVDADPTCGHAFEHNNQGVFVERQIEHMPAEEIDALYPKGKSRVLIGCAPCAPFSAYTPKHKQLRSGKWSLLSVFADRIRQLQPEIVSMENVPRRAAPPLMAVACSRALWKYSRQTITFRFGRLTAVNTAYRNGGCALFCSPQDLAR